MRIEARSFICHFHWFHVCDILFVSDLSLRFIDSANSMYSTVCDILPMNRANSDIAIVRSCIFHLGDVMVVLICNALHRFSHRFSCPVIRTTACAARFLRLLTLKTSRRDAQEAGNDSMPGRKTTESICGDLIDPVLSAAIRVANDRIEWKKYWHSKRC